MELKDRAKVQGQWGDEEARDQSAGGTCGSAIICLDLKASPDPPGGSALSQAPDEGTPARGVHTSMGWERENRYGSKSLLLSQRVQRTRRILRWVFSRAWVVEPVWRKEA